MEVTFGRTNSHIFSHRLMTTSHDCLKFVDTKAWNNVICFETSWRLTSASASSFEISTTTCGEGAGEGFGLANIDPRDKWRDCNNISCDVGDGKWRLHGRRGTRNRPGKSGQEKKERDCAAGNGRGRARQAARSWQQGQSRRGTGAWRTYR